MPRHDETELPAQLAIEHVELLLTAKAIAPGASFADCRTVAELRARAVAHVRGYDSIDGKCAAHIEGVFDALAERVSADPVRAALLSGRHLTH